MHVRLWTIVPLDVEYWHVYVGCRLVLSSLVFGRHPPYYAALAALTNALPRCLPVVASFPSTFGGIFNHHLHYTFKGRPSQILTRCASRHEHQVTQCWHQMPLQNCNRSSNSPSPFKLSTQPGYEPRRSPQTDHSKGGCGLDS